MTDHQRPSVERHCDVAVVGGSAAGLAAALQLGRQRRSVIVIDAGEGVPPSELTATGRAEVRSHGGEVIDGRVVDVTRTDDDRFRVELIGGHTVVARRVLAATGLVDQLPAIEGVAEHWGGDGHVAAVEPADGTRVGASISASLAREDIDAGARPSANEVDWDHRYAGERMWSGKPNGSLVAEIEGVTPGTALDVGAGEGGDAVWLAEQGWTVTASDISQRALDRVAAEAERRGLRIEGLRADANALGPFAPGAFDLVTAHYASIPRTPDARGVRHLLDAVAPGGTLLVVGHDLAPMRVPIDTHEHSRPFDPDAYLQVDDFASVLADAPGWEIEVHEIRPRGPGAASAQHHVDDVVLRARRRAG
jgi:SAM-dependent methyltransferase